MSYYDPKAARAKRPCPIWVDALLRDCGDLGPREFGVYMLILFKMWSNRECGLPDNDRALAFVARSSYASWRRHVRPRLDRFFFEGDGWIYQKRLLIEARKVEEFLAAQHARKTAKKSRLNSDPMKSMGYPEIALQKFPTLSGAKSLKTLKPHPTNPTSQYAYAYAANLDLIPGFEEALDMAALVERCELILGSKISRMTSFATMPEWLISWRRSGAQDFDIIVAMIGWARRDRRSAPSSPSYFTPIIEDTMRRRTKEREDQDGKGNRKTKHGCGDGDYVAAFLSAAECFDG